MEGRRRFLAQCGGVLLGLAGLKNRSVQAGEKSKSAVQWGMIIDLNRCTGCQSCVIACKDRNHTPDRKFYTRLLLREQELKHRSAPLFLPIQCNQCSNAPCVEACSYNATFQLENGIVVIDQEKCTGCGECIDACPYGARFANPSLANKADKCNFCLDRIEAGKEPYCVEACASGARLFGNISKPEGEFAKKLADPRVTIRDSKGIQEAAVRYIPLADMGRRIS